MCNKIHGAYIVSIDGKKIFTKEDALRVLKHLHDEHAIKFDIEFAPEKCLDALLLHKALVEHDLFQPDELDDSEHVAQILLEDIHSIAAIHFPEVDFHDPTISLDEIAVHVNAIQSHSLTPEEEALGHFTRQKLKTLSTWSKWHDGECQQLDHFHSLGMYGSPVKHPEGAIIL